MRGLQLALVCSADTHLQVTTELEKLRRDNTMGLIMVRNKVGREQWILEALIVTLDLFIVTFKPAAR